VQKCFCSFSLITVWLYNFWQKNIGSKAARKMLMKLTTCGQIADFEELFKMLLVFCKRVFPKTWQPSRI